jgi:hypothetical protein
MRIIDIVFGAFFIALGIAVAVLGSGWAYIAVAAMIGLGVQAVASGMRGRRSWLSMIGPLP